MPHLADLHFGAYAAPNRVAAQTASVILIAADANRKGLIVFNDSPNILYMKFGGPAKSNDFTLQVPPAQFYQAPWPLVPVQAIHGVWPGGASGSAMVTEIT